MNLIETLAICLYTIAIIWFSYNVGYNKAVAEVNELFEDTEDEDDRES